MESADQPKVIPIIEEELAAATRTVKTGSVQVHRSTQEQIQTLEFDLLRDAVEVRRVPVNQAIEEMPRVREEQDRVIVPVVEEEITITKRLVLKEEVHLIRRRTVEHETRQVAVRHDEIEVRRLDSEGREIGGQ